MISELVVTSAPRGLQAGRSGFTTVYRTKGIHPDLAARLEAASGYRHVFPQGDPRNPVIFSYTNSPSAIGEVWVMSRIGDAGTDYSGRSNKLAHHIALQQDDIRAFAGSNPAAVMRALAADQSLMSRWEGEPRESPVAPQIPVPPTSPGFCQTWATIGGDAGWAGFIAERAVSKQSTWIIVPPGTDLLTLFSEAFALVAPDQRWRIPFTTYSLRGDEGRWLGAVAGSPEAASAAGQSRIPVIDLTRRMSASAEGAYVAAARGQGVVPWQRVPQTGPTHSSPPAASLHRSSPPPAAPFGLGGAPSPPVVPPVLTRTPAPGTPQPPEMTEWEDVPLPRKRFYRIALVVAGSGLLLCFSLAALILAHGTDVLKNVLPRETASHQAPQASVAKQPESPASEIDQSQEDRTKPSPGKLAEGGAKEKMKEVEATQPIGPTGKAPGDKQVAHPESRKPVDELLFAALEKFDNLPAQEINGERPSDGIISLIEWAEEADPESLKQVSLMLPEIKWPENHSLRVGQPDDTGTSRKWPCFQGDEEQPFGWFVLGVKGLSFEVSQNEPKSSGRNTLAFVPLRLAVTDTPKPGWLQLVKPKPREALRFGSEKPRQAQDNPNGDGAEGFLEKAIREEVSELRWKDCKMRPESPGSPLQISKRNIDNVEFEDLLATDFPLHSGSPIELWWRPSAFAEKQDGPPSLFREQLKVTVDPKFDKTGLSLNGLSNFVLNDTLGQAAKEKTRNTKNLLINQREKKTNFSYMTFIDNFKIAAGRLLPENNKWQELGPNEKVKRFQNLLASDEVKDESIEKWLERVKPDLASKGPVKDAIEEEVRNFLEKNPYQPKQQSPAEENPDDKKKREQKEKEDYEQFHRNRISNDCSQSLDFLLKVIERLDPAADDSIEWAGLFFWHTLWKYNEALKYGFVCSPSLQSDKDRVPLLVLEEIADKAYLTVSGELNLQWKSRGNEIPPVRIVRFGDLEKTEADEGQAAAELQSKSENQAGDTSRQEGGD